MCRSLSMFLTNRWKCLKYAAWNLYVHMLDRPLRLRWSPQTDSLWHVLPQTVCSSATRTSDLRVRNLTRTKEPNSFSSSVANQSQRLPEYARISNPIQNLLYKFYLISPACLLSSIHAYNVHLSSHLPPSLALYHRMVISLRMYFSIQLVDQKSVSVHAPVAIVVLVLRSIVMHRV